MKLAAVTMVKDEADIIEETLRHTLGFAENVIVADNLSTDDTPHILDALASEFPGRLLIEQDSEVAYYQARKMSALIVEAAERFSPDWIVPFDADEYWFVERTRLSKVLPFYDAVAANVNEYFMDEPVEIPRLQKVLVRGNGKVGVTQGNHAAQRFDGGPAYIASACALIKHYPWRSEEQFVRKIRNGVAAYAAAPDLPSQFGRHWKIFAGMSEDELRKVWHEDLHRRMVLSPPVSPNHSR